MPHSNAFDACAGFETAILDYLDGTLNEADRRRVEMHLANCTACEAFWQEQRKLDTVLSGALHRPTVPVQFKERMLELAQAELGHVQSIASKPTLHTGNEVENAFAGFRRTFLRGAALSLLDGLGVLTVAALVTMLGYELLTRSALLSSLSSQQINSYGATAIGLAALLGGVWLGFGEKIRSLLEER